MKKHRQKRAGLRLPAQISRQCLVCYRSFLPMPTVPMISIPSVIPIAVIPTPMPTVVMPAVVMASVIVAIPTGAEAKRDCRRSANRWRINGWRRANHRCLINRRRSASDWRLINGCRGIHGRRCGIHGLTNYDVGQWKRRKRQVNPKPDVQSPRVRSRHEAD